MQPATNATANSATTGAISSASCSGCTVVSKLRNDLTTPNAASNPTAHPAPTSVNPCRSTSSNASHAQRIAQILQKRVEKMRAARLAACFPKFLVAAEFEPRLAFGFGG
jgi:hypothetical protein